MSTGEAVTQRRARPFPAVVKTEARKAVRSPIFAFTLAMVVAMAFMVALLMWIKKDPSLAAGILAGASQIDGEADWHTYLGMVAQSSVGASLIVYGLVAAWVFGREFVDRTAVDLLALPLSRHAIAAGKLAVCAAWCILLFLVSMAAHYGVGAALDLDGWSPGHAVASFKGFAAAAALSLGLSAVAALLASVSRGYLVPVIFTVTTVMLISFMSAIGFGTWYPWGIPFSFAMAGVKGGDPGWVGGVVVIAVSLAAAVATSLYWRHADR